MASPLRTQRPSSKDDPRLNVRSAAFDAEFSIRELLKPDGDSAAQPTLMRLPHKVFPMDNLRAARVLLPASHPDYMQQFSSASLTSRVQEHRITAAAAEDARREERKRLKQLAKDQYINPLDALVASFGNGPMRLLRDLSQNKQRVKVVTRRPDGVRGTCVGFVRSFDKHWNLLMYDVDEEYRCYEYATISSDGRTVVTIDQRLSRFLRLYCPEKANNVGAIVKKYQGRYDALWAFLHTKYGLTARVEQEISRDRITTTTTRNNNNSSSSNSSSNFPSCRLKAADLLLSFAGREPVLMHKLGIPTKEEKAQKFGNQACCANDQEYCVQALWIRKASEKYPGNFFFFNVETKQSLWHPPPGIKFKQVRYLVTRKRTLRQILLRGDSLITCSKA